MCQNGDPSLAEFSKFHLEGLPPGKHDNGSILDQVLAELSGEFAKQPLGSVPHHGISKTLPHDDTHVTLYLI